MEQTVKPVRSKDNIPFHCTQCGACCRDMEDKIMLEAYDAYRLGQYLRTLGTVENIEDIYEKYTSPMLLSEGFPIFTLRACGEDHHCIFLVVEHLKKESLLPLRRELADAFTQFRQCCDFLLEQDALQLGKVSVHPVVDGNGTAGVKVPAVTIHTLITGKRPAVISGSNSKRIDPANA